MMALLKDCWDGRWPFECRKVFEIMANIRVAHPRGEDDPHQGYYTKTMSYHVIATDEASARLAWWQRYHRDGENKIITCEIIASVDAEIETRTR